MNDWRNVDWHRYVQRLSLLPGLDTLFVWRYEDTADVLRLVLRRMLRWKVGGNVELPEKRSHRGLSQKALLRVLEWTEEGRTGKLGHEARSAHPVTDTNPPFRLFSPDQVAAAAAAYQQQLDRIETTEKVKLLHPPKAAAQG